MVVTYGRMQKMSLLRTASCRRAGGRLYDQSMSSAPRNVESGSAPHATHPGPPDLTCAAAREPLRTVIPFEEVCENARLAARTLLAGFYVFESHSRALSSTAAAWHDRMALRATENMGLIGDLARFQPSQQPRSRQEHESRSDHFFRVHERTSLPCQM